MSLFGKGGCMGSFQEYVSSEWQSSLLVDKRMVDLNIRRTKMGFFIATPVFIILMITFLFFHQANTPEEEAWRIGIATCHGILTVSMLVLFLMTQIYQSKLHHYWFARVIQFLGITTILSAGIAITLIDLKILTAISPYLIASMITGVIFLMRPLHAAIIYITGYLTFLIFVLGMNLPPAVLLSTASNAVMASAIGFVTSFLMFRSQKRQFLQQDLVSKQQQDLEALNQNLRHLANHDELTDLYNRRTFTSKVKASIENRTDYLASIALFDIDHFKQINDQYGHPAGDYILKALASLILNDLVEGELFARFGGEEFIIYFPGIDKQKAYERCEHFRKVIEQAAFSFQGEKIFITASFGVTHLAGLMPSALDRAYTRADKAMYLAKESGRNLTKMSE